MKAAQLSLNQPRVQCPSPLTKIPSKIKFCQANLWEQVNLLQSKLIIAHLETCLEATVMSITSDLVASSTRFLKMNHKIRLQSLASRPWVNNPNLKKGIPFSSNECRKKSSSLAVSTSFFHRRRARQLKKFRKTTWVSLSSTRVVPLEPNQTKNVSQRTSQNLHSSTTKSDQLPILTLRISKISLKIIIIMRSRPSRN